MLIKIFVETVSLNRKISLLFIFFPDLRKIIHKTEQVSLVEPFSKTATLFTSANDETLFFLFGTLFFLGHSVIGRLGGGGG